MFASCVVLCGKRLTTFSSIEFAYSACWELFRQFGIAWCSQSLGEGALLWLWSSSLEDSSLCYSVVDLERKE